MADCPFYHIKGRLPARLPFQLASRNMQVVQYGAQTIVIEELIKDQSRMLAFGNISAMEGLPPGYVVSLKF